MSDDSGIWPRLRPNSERGEPRQKVAIPVTWAVLVSIVSAGATWGIMSQRMTDLDRRVEQTDRDLRQVELAVSGHDTKIEVDRTQYAEILRRLNDLNEKIERGK